MPACAGMTGIAAACQDSLMTEGRYCVYIMASRRNGTLYIGVTNHLAARAFEHRSGHGSQFTSKYAVTRLVWYERHADINEAIAREKQLKKWERRWKLDLIESVNPGWADLYETLNG
jgi:putative endonuclease